MPLINQNFSAESYFSIQSEDELVKSFRLRDQKKLTFPTGLTYPFNVKSYFTWQDPNGVYTYLVMQRPNWDMPRGIAFKRTPNNGEPTGGLCNWCYAYGSSEDIGMLTLNLNANVTVGYHICLDLRCIEKIEETAAREGKSPDKAAGALYERMNHLFENLAKA
jgi:hypothetical protein